MPVQRRTLTSRRDACTRSRAFRTVLRLQDHLNSLLGRPRQEPRARRAPLPRHRPLQAHQRQLRPQFWATSCLLAVARRPPHDDTARRPGRTIGGDEFVILLGQSRRRRARRSRWPSGRVSACSSLSTSAASRSSRPAASIGVSLSDGNRSSLDAEALIRGRRHGDVPGQGDGRDAVCVFDSVDARLCHAARRARSATCATRWSRTSCTCSTSRSCTFPMGTIEWTSRHCCAGRTTRGQLLPATFVPARRGHRAHRADRGVVIEEACRQLVWWRKEIPNGEDLYVAVNLLGASTALIPQLMPCVRNALKGEKLAPLTAR